MTEVHGEDVVAVVETMPLGPDLISDPDEEERDPEDDLPDGE